MLQDNWIHFFSKLDSNYKSIVLSNIVGAYFCIRVSIWMYKLPWWYWYHPCSCNNLPIMVYPWCTIYWFDFESFFGIPSCNLGDAGTRWFAMKSTMDCPWQSFEVRVSYCIVKEEWPTSLIWSRAMPVMSLVYVEDWLSILRGSSSQPNNIAPFGH